MKIVNRFILPYDEEKPAEEKEGGDKKFSQADLDRILAQDKRNYRKQAEEMAQRLEEIKKDFAGTASQKEALETEIASLQTQYKSEQEIAREKADSDQKKFAEDLKTAGAAASSWQTRYEGEVVETSLLGAATSGGAYNASQLADLLRPNAKVIEVAEDGKPTGAFKVVVDFNTVNDKKEPVTLQLSPVDVVERMKANVESFGNLFAANVQGGLGKKGPTETADIVKDATKSFANWTKARKENPEALGL